VLLTLYTGLVKPKKYDWKDSNLALFGSDTEKQVKSKTSCLVRFCAYAMMPVRLSVTEVHWRIIANLGFKFRSHFTAHCGRRAAGGRRAARRASCGRIISRHASQC